MHPAYIGRMAFITTQKLEVGSKSQKNLSPAFKFIDFCMLFAFTSNP